MENVNNRNFTTGREHLKIISGKTAALFEAAFHAARCCVSRPKNRRKPLLQGLGIMWE